MLAVPLALWNALVVISTVPIGGHYVIDLIAGAAVCVALLLLTRDRRSKERTIPEMSPVGIHVPAPGAA